MKSLIWIWRLETLFSQPQCALVLVPVKYLGFNYYNTTVLSEAKTTL